MSVESVVYPGRLGVFSVDAFADEIVVEVRGCRRRLTGQDDLNDLNRSHAETVHERGLARPRFRVSRRGRFGFRRTAVRRDRRWAPNPGRAG